MTDNFYMQLALDKAWEYQFLTYPNPAVGAVVVGDKGQILSIAAHQKAGGPHAEVLALQEAFSLLTHNDEILKLTSSHDIHEYLAQNHHNIFEACTIYVTLEPCNHTGKTPACASLLEIVNIQNIVIGHTDEGLASGGSSRLRSLGRNVVEDVLSQACHDLLEPFLLWSQKKQFNLFKIAQRLNGTIDGGTISCEASRRHVHKIRAVVEQMVIGGNTVRIDRPLLDCRLTGDQAPDIKILSRSDAFDETIPLFCVPNRSVEIRSDISKVLESPFTLIEGGTGTFKACEPFLDWILVYQSASIGSGKTLNNTFDGRILHAMPLGDDYLFWIKRKNIE